MKIDFQKYPDGLVPTIIQDAKSGVVLMLGFMNEEALTKTLAEKRVTFFSRSKQRLWTKGETSGHFLDVASVMTDCDADTILVKATPNGPVCHTGNDTCFGEFNGKGSDEQEQQGAFLASLERVINDRFEHQNEGSYVASLAKKGIKKMAQKVGEEAVELVLEAQDDQPTLFLGEAADLVFHLLVLLRAKGFSLSHVEAVLRSRMK